jgi:hypothetical protein
MRVKLLFIVALALSISLIATVPVQSQCGNVNNDPGGNVDISDLSYMISYMIIDAPPPANPADAEFDDRAGITISDAVQLVQYLFQGQELACGASGSYSFAASTLDTVYVPRLLNIPDDIDQVVLPIRFALESTTDGLYIPIIPLGPGSDSRFQLDSIATVYSQAYLDAPPAIVDTTVLVGIDLADNNFIGHRELYRIYYSRVESGPANIVTEVVDRAAPWKYAVEKGGDLFRPQLSYYDVEIPPETLLVSRSSMSFVETAGVASEDTVWVDFATTSVGIQFNLIASDSWIVTPEPPLGGWTTPVTIPVTVGSDAMTAGSYHGNLAVETVGDPGPASNVSQIDIDVTVWNPQTFPAGDFNCDGLVDIGDFTMFISWMYLGGPPLQYCQ